jgi:uncharacterized membrane protein YeaQ/YmgE (transglycosylase-associated protein family)
LRENAAGGLPSIALSPKRAASSIIGFLAGVIARFFHPGNKYEPKGFILTTLLGIVGAFVATYLSQR